MSKRRRSVAFCARWGQVSLDNASHPGHAQGDADRAIGDAVPAHVEFGRLAEVVGLGQPCVSAGPEGLGARAGPDTGLHRPARQLLAPVGERQRDQEPVQAIGLCRLVVVALERKLVIPWPLKKSGLS